MSDAKDSFIHRRLDEHNEELISFCCEGCVAKLEEDKILSFYPGSKEGYGPFLFSCSLCGAILYDGETKGEE
jgi:hypothetical protein